MAEHDLAPHELRVVVAVEQARSFSGAAAALGLTQSAVSHSVRGTERKIGAVLFDRGRRGATPTPAGERAAAHARRVLRLLETLAAEARRGAAADGGP
ncbi:LysR family transcriptional regulator, partial [Streptomyces longispororuber]|uniref:LysR family transcriptional regulator n=1 Tax=Streptomyces longispororuber TaxID=68230 RepID=UPI00167D8F78